MEDQLKKIISMHLGKDPADIKTHMSFIDDLGADSLDTVELVMMIEEEFECEIPDEVAENLHTVQDMLDYLEKSG
jgi:acyl carrier protein